MTDRELMQQALNALEDADTYVHAAELEPAISALREALAEQPAQRKPLDIDKKIEIAELASMKFEWSSDYMQAISFVVEQCESAHGIKENT